MPELKIDFKNLGPIRLLPIDTASLFLPFGRPVADYVSGVVGAENGLRKMSRQGAMDFPITVSWSSIEGSLSTTGFDEESAAAADEVETIEAGGEIAPPVAGFMEWFDGSDPRDIQPRGGNAEPIRKVQLAVLAQAQVKFPRVTELPLRPRMTFAPHPALGKSKAGAKSGPVLVTKPVMTPSVAKPAAPTPPLPTAKAPVSPKIDTPAVQKPPVVAPAASPVESPAPKLSAPKVVVPEPPATQKVGPPPKPVAPAVKAPTAPKPEEIKTSVRVAAQVVPEAPRVEAKLEPKLEPKPEPKREVLKPDPAPEVPAPAVDLRKPEPVMEANLSFGQTPSSGGGLPTFVKVGIPVILALAGGGYYLYEGSNSKPASSPKAPQAITMGEQGWVTEWASDTVGSRRARQITLYRPSMKLTDYKFEFIGTIESKALGWVFRASDTNNYYGMKLEIARPGPSPALVISRFAVVDGRESSVSQKPLPIVAQMNTPFNVKLDVSGPRYTVYVQGQPVDVWTDNRLKQGAVGFMNEREERARTSSVHFSYPTAGGN